MVEIPFYLFLQSTEYKGEYWKDHPTIRLFWEVFHSLPLEKKKQFLCKYFCFCQLMNSLFFFIIAIDLYFEIQFKKLNAKQCLLPQVFLTGSDRIPILGMKNLKLVIQPTSGGEHYLPVAHTCFNLLDLPKYKSLETLCEKLLQAIDHNQGFNLA